MFEDKIANLFIEIDDFCKDLDIFSIKNQLCDGLGKKRRNRETQLSISEMMAIYCEFHLSNKTTFKSYYKEYTCLYLC